MEKRMKQYENVNQNYLMKKVPVCVRVDGRSFHTFTKNFEKPFDYFFVKTMQDTMIYLCKNIQGCVFGYTQSDEISLILLDYLNFETEAWFDYNVQKLNSITASLATLAFNKYYRLNIQEIQLPYTLECMSKEKQESFIKNYKAYHDQKDCATFDSRCFNIPKEEVTNLLYWRQLNAVSNSIQAVGQTNFSHKKLLNKSCKEIKTMLIEEKGLNWDNLETHLQRGSCCKKNAGKWKLDMHIPLFKGKDREYIESILRSYNYVYSKNLLC